LSTLLTVAMDTFVLSDISRMVAIKPLL